MRMTSLLGQVAAPTVAEADSGRSGADSPPGPDQSPYAHCRPLKVGADCWVTPGSIGDLLPLSLKRECHPGEGGPRLGAPHDRGVPAGGAGPGGGVAPSERDLRSMPTPLSSTWRVSVLAVMSTPTNTRPRVRLGVPDHIGQRLAQRGQRVIAELLGNRAVQRISVILGLKRSTGVYDRQGNAVGVLRLRPAAGLPQARPDPIPAEWSPLNQALLVW